MSAFLVACGIYLLAVHSFARWHGLEFHLAFCAHLGSTVVAVVLGYVFVICGGETVAQFAIGSSVSEDTWSMWVGIWPGLLLFTVISVAFYLIWTGIAVFVVEQRSCLPLSISGAVMAVFSLVAVFAKMPTA